MSAFKRLPMDIVKNILPYDSRFVIRNGEIIQINKLDMNKYKTAALNLLLHRPERKMRQTHSKIRWLEALPSVKSTDGLTFSSSFLVIEEVKDEIQNSFGLCCL